MKDVKVYKFNGTINIVADNISQAIDKFYKDKTDEVTEEITDIRKVCDAVV